MTPPLSEKVRHRKPADTDTLANGKIRRTLALRGAKRQRSGGVMRSLNGVTPLRSAPKGDFADMKSIVLSAEDRARPQLPLNDAASAVYWDGRRRACFWESVHHEHVPVGVAGQQWLDVQARRAEQVLTELEKAGGPLHWFRRKATEGLLSGKFHNGLVVEAGPVADLFFDALVDEPNGVMIRALGGERRVDFWDALVRLDGVLERNHFAFMATRNMRPLTPKRGCRG